MVHCFHIIERVDVSIKVEMSGGLKTKQSLPTITTATSTGTLKVTVGPKDQKEPTHNNKQAASSTRLIQAKIYLLNNNDMLKLACAYTTFSSQVEFRSHFDISLTTSFSYSNSNNRFGESCL